MQEIVFEPWAKTLLVAHAIGAVVLVGSVGHLGYESWRMLRGQARRPWLTRVHARVGFVLYGLEFLLGLLAYPTYRVRVRHDVFDPTMPWASNLFDIKEMWAAFGLAAFAAMFVMSFAVRFEEPEHRPMAVGFASLGLLVTGITAFALVSGFVLVTHRSL